jgi:hypothetical protein
LNLIYVNDLLADTQGDLANWSRVRGTLDMANRQSSDDSGEQRGAQMVAERRLCCDPPYCDVQRHQ